MPPRIVIGPLLQAALHSRTVFVDGGVYVGRARNPGTDNRAPNEEVQLGVTGGEAAIERYLAAHPTPETW